MRYLARQQLARLSYEIPSCSANDEATASASTQTPATVNLPPSACIETVAGKDDLADAEELKEQTDEDSEFELDLNDTDEIDETQEGTFHESSLQTDLSCDSFNQADGMYELSIHEFKKYRMRQCLDIMGRSQVNKYRSTQQLQGGGCDVVLDYFPYIAAMARHDDLTPSNKLSRRRTRASKLSQSTALEPADLAALAGIGTINDCTTFREATLAAAWNFAEMKAELAPMHK